MFLIFDKENVLWAAGTFVVTENRLECMKNVFRKIDTAEDRTSMFLCELPETGEYSALTHKITRTQRTVTA